MARDYSITPERLHVLERRTKIGVSPWLLDCILGFDAGSTLEFEQEPTAVSGDERLTYQRLLAALNALESVVSAGQSERREFKAARENSGLTAWDVDKRAGLDRGSCANLEHGRGAFSSRERRKLLRCLEAIVVYECEPTRNYQTAILAYKERHGVSRAELARRLQLSQWALRNIERGLIKRRPFERSRAKLDALLFDA